MALLLPCVRSSMCHACDGFVRGVYFFLCCVSVAHVVYDLCARLVVPIHCQETIFPSSIAECG